MKKFLLLSTLFFVVTASRISAQTLSQSIRGTVTDKESRQPLFGASVVIMATDPLRGTLTDSLGRFKLQDVPLGRYDLKFHFIGYSDVVLPNVELRAGKEVVLRIELEEAVTVSQEVVVSANKSKSQLNNEMAIVSARLFTIEESKRYAGSLNDPARMAANFAGVSGANDARNDIIIRGNSPTGLLWRLEGVDIPNPNHFAAQGTTGGPVSILNNNVLDNSDFFTGAFPSEYGDVTSGVFDLRMRNGNNEKREYTAQAGLNGLELMTEGPISKETRSSYLASFRYQNLILFDKLGINLGPAGIPIYEDLSFKLNFPKVGKGQFEWFGIGGNSYIVVRAKNKKPENLSYGANISQRDVYYGSKMAATGLAYTRSIKSGYWKTILFFTAEQHYTHVDSLAGTGDIANWKPYDFYNENATYYHTGIHSFLNKKFNARNTFKTGIIATRLDFTNEQRVWQSWFQYWRYFNQSSGNTYFGQAYAQWKHSFSDRLNLLGGLQYERFFLNNAQSIEPRAGLRYYLSPNQSLSLGFGIQGQLQPLPVYFKKAEQVDIYGRPQGGYTLSNHNLGFTHSRHYILAYDRSLSPQMRLKVETYYQQLYDVPVMMHPSSYSMLNYGSDFIFPQVDSLTNKGTGHNKGVEVTLEKFFSHGYYYLLTASVFDSKYKGSDGIERNTAFNSRFTTNILLGKEWKVGKNSRVSFDWKLTYAGGRYHSPIDTIASHRDGAIRYDNDQLYTARYPDYFKMDLRLGYKMNFRKFSQEFALDVQNITDRRNVLAETYDFQQHKVDTEYQLGRFPVALYRVEF